MRQEGWSIIIAVDWDIFACRNIFFVNFSRFIFVAIALRKVYV